MEAGGGGASVPTTSALPRLPAVPGGGTGAGGSGSTIDGTSGGGMQSGIGAALIALLTLVLLRLARRAGAKPIWRAYRPEISPA
jgi:hypothetical protein